MTFTPVVKGAGARHFEMTQHLIEKMGGVVFNSFCKNDGWKECVPGNYNWVKDECIEIFNTEVLDKVERKPAMDDRPSRWVEQYKDWDAKWNS